MASPTATARPEENVAIPGQQHMLSRLEYLIRTTCRFHILHGSQGAGKSHLTKQLIKQCNNILTASVDGRQHQSVEAMRQALIFQLVSDQFVDQQRSLQQTLSELITQAALPVLIVVDNADELPASVVAELWGALLQSDALSSTESGINIVLVGNSAWAGEFVQGVASNVQQWCNTLELLAMGHEDAVSFLSKCHPQASKADLEELLAPLPARALLPGVLLGMTMNGSSRRPWVIPMTVGVSGLLSAILGLVWWLWSDVEPNHYTADIPLMIDVGDGGDKKITPADHDTNSFEVDKQQQVVSTPETVAVEEETPDRDAILFASDWGKEAVSETGAPPVQLTDRPEVIVGEGETVTSPAAKASEGDAIIPVNNRESIKGGVPATGEREQRRERGSETPLMQDPTSVEATTRPVSGEALPTSEALAGSDTGKIAEAIAETAPDNRPLPVAVHESNNPSNQLPSSIEPETEVTVVSPLNNSGDLGHLDEQRILLMAIPSSHFSLMLGGFSSLETTREVVGQLTDRKQLMIYRTRRNGRPWYVLIYGNFSSRAAAENRLANMPATLQRFSPWIKSFSRIQQELQADVAN